MSTLNRDLKEKRKQKQKQKQNKTKTNRKKNKNCKETNKQINKKKYTN